MLSPNIVILAILLTAVAGDGTARCTEISGNWYCSAVEAITYTNFGNPSSYREIT